MLCRRLDIIKIETIVRNVVAGSLAKRTGLAEGTPVRPPIVELYLQVRPPRRPDDQRRPRAHAQAGLPHRARLDPAVPR